MVVIDEVVVVLDELVVVVDELVVELVVVVVVLDAVPAQLLGAAAFNALYVLASEPSFTMFPPVLGPKVAQYCLWCAAAPVVTFTLTSP